MTDISPKVISLRSSSFEESVEPEILVNGLIGPGVTVIATPQDKDHLRYIFCEQMAAAVAKGDKFLDFFDTHQCHVLLVAHGIADFKGMEERGIATVEKVLETRYEWPKIGQGCIRELQQHKKVYPDFKLAFLGNFGFIKSTPGIWMEKEHKIKEESLSKGYTSHDFFYKDMEIENVHRLRNFCFENDVSIIIGHDLTQRKNKLHLTWGLYKCDNEIHLRGMDRAWRLVVEPKRNKNYIQTNSWELTYDDHYFFQITEQQIREARMMEARSKGQLPLNDNEMKIIDTIWGQEPMSVKQIAVVTGVNRSTVDQKLKALEGSNKGHWVVSLKGDKGKEYVVDTTKERDWI
jgi:DNA-binding MarR family transcriptional regulator